LLGKVAAKEIQTGPKIALKLAAPPAMFDPAFVRFRSEKPSSPDSHFSAKSYLHFVTAPAKAKIPT
jgi:hypothetical protein